MNTNVNAASFSVHRRGASCGILVPAVLSVALPSPASVLAQMPVTKVVVAEAKVVEAPHTITLVGTVEPLRRSRVSSEIAGLVRAMPGREGDFIAAGEIVCSLNDDTLKLRLAEEQAELAALQARHDELLAGTRKEELLRLKALLDESVARYERWKFEMERVERLYAGSESNDKEYYDTKAEYLAAQRRKLAAQATYDLAVAGPRKEVIAQAAHEVAEQKAVVDRVASDLSKTHIRAPFAGFVVDRLVEVGEWISAGDPVVEMADLSAVLVRVDVPESALPYLVAGHPVRVKIDALQRSFEGRIKYIMRQADPDARTFPVKVEVDNGKGLIAGGMFARVVMPAGPGEQVVAVPKDAVVEKEGNVYVAMLLPARRGKPGRPAPIPARDSSKPGASRERELVRDKGAGHTGHNGGMAGMLLPVTIGADVGDWIAITSGNLRPGTPVITRGTERMLPFPTPVEIVDELGTPVAMPDVDDKPSRDREGAGFAAPAKGGA